MVQAQLTKQKLIETAAQLIYQQGWNATGINQILTTAQVPKGSFYYYFSSKDDLGVAIVEHHLETVEKLWEKTFLNLELDPREALESYFREYLEVFRAAEWKWGCPVGTFVNETADSNEKIAQTCRKVFDRANEVIGQAIKRGQKQNVIDPTESAEALATKVMCVWQGCLLLMKVHHKEYAVKMGMELIEQLLFRSPNS